MRRSAASTSPAAAAACREAPSELRPLREQLGRPLPARGVVVAVDEAGQAQELVDERALVLERPADGLAVRRARVALQDAEVLPQAVPAREAVAARDHELGVGPRERVELRALGRSASEPRVELAHELEGLRGAVAHQPLQPLGLVAQVLEARVAGERAGRHVWPPLPLAWRPHPQAEGEVRPTSDRAVGRWATPSPRTGGALRATVSLAPGRAGGHRGPTWRSPAPTTPAAPPAPAAGSGASPAPAGPPAPAPGSPRSRMTPSCRKHTSFATRRANAISCVATIMVMPSRFSSPTTSSTSPTSSGSSALVISSSSSTRGFVATARTIATRCCWPPDSRSG